MFNIFQNVAKKVIFMIVEDTLQYFARFLRSREGDIYYTDTVLIITSILSGASGMNA